jgi:alpha-beta hydrolase superfamily lysophospholipase
MDKAHSSDGTTIAFDRLGAGPPVVLVSGASTARSIHAHLAELLAADFTVFNYDRRGRGDSGDTPPYTVQREVEDLQAVIAAAGGSAAVFGNSSGAVLALHAAAVGLPEAMIAGIRQAPVWPGMEALAPTLAYDATVMGDSLVPAGVVASVKAATLVLDGSETGAWAANAARALIAELPVAARRTLDGQDHNVAWDVLAPVLREFFAG